MAAPTPAWSSPIPWARSSPTKPWTATRDPVALVTFDSPLGLRTVIYDRLHPQPPHVPQAVTRWDNLVDRDDLVDAHLDLQPYFPPALLGDR